MRRRSPECMSRILPYVDLVIGNEEDAEKVLGIKAAGTTVEAGRISPAAYEDVARQIRQQFPASARWRLRSGRAFRPVTTTGARCSTTPKPPGLFAARRRALSAHEMRTSSIGSARATRLPPACSTR